MKMFVCTIGYQDFAMTPEQGVVLLQALAPARYVKRPSYNKPYEFQEDGEHIITEMRLCDVAAPLPPEPPAPDPEPLGTTHQPLALPLHQPPAPPRDLPF